MSRNQCTRLKNFFNFMHIFANFPRLIKVALFFQHLKLKNRGEKVAGTKSRGVAQCFCAKINSRDLLFPRLSVPIRYTSIIQATRVPNLRARFSFLFFLSFFFSHTESTCHHAPYSLSLIASQQKLGMIPVTGCGFLGCLSTSIIAFYLLIV